MLTVAILDADRAMRRWTGRGLRRDTLDGAGADPMAPATFETSVIRLPPPLATRLEQIATDIAAAQPGQYVCPADSIHVTVCGPTHLADAAAVVSALEDLASVALSLSGGRLRIVRLAVGGTSVFAALDPDGLDLAGVRGTLAGRWGVAGRRGLGGALVGRMLWANLIRFRKPPSAELVAAVDRVRRVQHTGFVPGSIDLVRTNRAMGPARTTVLGTVVIPAAGR